MSNLIDTKKIKEYYTFHHVDHETEEEVYFCNCGKKITQENNLNKNPEEVEVTISVDKNKYYSDMDIYDKIDDAVTVICPKCEADYSKQKNFNRIKPSNHYFYGSFKFEETEDRLTLYKVKIKSHCTAKSKYVKFKEAVSYIAVDKKQNKLFLKGYFDKQEFEFSLDTIVRFVSAFYESDGLNVMDNLIDVHRFLNSLAGFVSDTDNMDIVEGLMSKMIGRPGIDVMKKITTIFFGIICYSNLSTIALTKGTVFLYDMMDNCHLPEVKTLRENKVTSPLKIFNFLVSLENEEAQKEIESEQNTGDFVYESKDGRSLNLKFDLERFGFSRTSKIDRSYGNLNVREDLKHKTVSKYIFNNIKTFEDYRRIIRYTKFISYEELINLVMKYDMEFLINLFSIIEFRDGINMESLNQIIPLVMDDLKRHAKNKHGFAHSLLEQMENYGNPDAEEEEEEVDDSELKLDYNLVRMFNFHAYDDSVRMIEELKWDRKKEFDKIKTISELTDYHNKLVEHYNMLTDKEKYEKFNKFAKKFEYLEKYKDTLKVKLLSTPSMVLEAAKDMKNCAGSYVTRISQGRYILLLVWDKSKRKSEDENDYFMMGLNVTDTGLEFDQLKSVCNYLGSDRQKKLVMTYLKNKDISFREVRDLRIVGDKKKKTPGSAVWF